MKILVTGSYVLWELLASGHTASNYSHTVDGVQVVTTHTVLHRLITKLVGDATHMV